MMRLRTALRATLVALATALCSVAAAEPNWTQFRGPGGQGISDERNIPLEWSDTKNVLWKTEVPGAGRSQPIVWGDRIFLTTSIEGEVVAPGAKGVVHKIEGEDFHHPDGVGADRKHTFKVLAYEAKTGKPLWEQTAWEGTPYDTRHRGGAYAAPTAVTDGKVVIAWFGSEGLYAYDFDGKPLWKKDLARVKTMGVGVGTSPLLYKDVVIVQCDEDNGDTSFVVGLDKQTGKEVWRQPRKVQLSWATPIVVQTGKRDELVTSGNEHIIAYDPATGAELWRTKGIENNAVPSPVASGDIVVLAAGYQNKLAMGIRIGGSGDVTGSNILWKYTKGIGYVPSPIAYDGYVYLVHDRGQVTCLDAKTGEVKYEGARVPKPATFMASPFIVNGRMFWSSDDGDTFVFKPGPTFEILGTNSLSEPIVTSPAIAAGRIYIRGARHLFAIGS